MFEQSLARSLIEMPAEWRKREAFRSSSGSLSFSELREGVLRAATWLGGELGIRPGERVAICLPKSFETVELILAVLAVGGVYVPLQFQGPAARLNRILRSTSPRLLVTTGEMAAQLGAEEGWPGVPVWRLACAGQGLAALLPGVAAAKTIAPRASDDLAALYFTSGSTGEPKGVMLSHANIAAGVAFVIRQDRLSEKDYLFSHSSLHYAAYDMFFPLAIGCRTFLLSSREAMLPAPVAEVVERERITVWRSSVTGLRLLLESGELAGRDFGSLRLLGFFGEFVPIPLLRRLSAALPATTLAITYGATEAYRISSFVVPRVLPDDAASLPVGALGDDYALSFRDEEGNEPEHGAAGEICVAGPLVMQGYWMDPALSESRRLPGRPQSWRTGDQGYLDGDGLLHLIGRRDHMVKLRGHRFDLGEIESAMKAHPEVLDAVAFAVPAADGGTEVRAAVATRSGIAGTGELRALCARRLPAFARPASIIELAEFPLLSTGKIDRRALKALVSLQNPSSSA